MSENDVAKVDAGKVSEWAKALETIPFAKSYPTLKPWYFAFATMAH